MTNMEAPSFNKEKHIRKSRLLILIVAYYAEQTITSVLGRIPPSLVDDYEVEVLVIDDSSTDSTFERSVLFRDRDTLCFPIRVLFNPVNQGYGGNQKIGYHYALLNNFDFVALIHGDGQYAPECLPDLLAPVANLSCQACFGSRMMKKDGALSGGMPLYKFIGNKILSWFENKMLRSSFTELHSGYRIYSVAALSKVPFQLNTNDFHFDTEIIIQFLIAGLVIMEKPIPTYYGNEICRVNGLKYALNVVRAVLKARLQEIGLFFDPKFDCALGEKTRYFPKLDYTSTHSLAIETVTPGSRVLDFGCASGFVAQFLRKEKKCTVIGVDFERPSVSAPLDGFIEHNLNTGLPDVSLNSYDYILMLDVIEHLSNPEKIITELRNALKFAPNAKLVASTGNIAFIILRIQLLLGQFNYGKRGILDLTHTRLFTFSSFRRLFEQNGFRILQTNGIPVPFPLAIGNNWVSRFFIFLNRLLIYVWRSLFSYQIFLVASPYPSLEFLLQNAISASAEKEATIAGSGELECVTISPELHLSINIPKPVSG
jgi:2-polyprenyl-3-methyl-5-hydroxy-6-metoxy-1,4-benzoquinol methylase